MTAIPLEQARRQQQRDREKASQDPPKPNGHAAAAGPVERPWPVLDPTACHGILGEIVELIRPNTEADPVAVLAHLLAFFGNAAGRSARYEVEGVWHTANLFLTLVGVTSRSRKGTAGARAKQVFKIADPEWHDHRIRDGMSSGEGLIYHVRDEVEQEILVDKKAKRTERIVTDHGVADKRLCVLESEFGRALQVKQRQGNTLSPVLRSAWESGRLMSLTKNTPTEATGAHITIVAHITADELLRDLDDCDIANGLANRFIFLAARRSRVLPHGGAEIDFAACTAELRQALAFAGKAGRVTMDDDARALWEEVYPDLTGDVPGLLGTITARAAPQVVRMALIYALADRAYQIGEPHLSAALALWRYSEASVKQIFGDALGDPIADTILAALRQRKPDALSRTDLNNLFGRNVDAGRITLALNKLLTAGKVQMTMIGDGPGRPTEMWAAT